MAWLTSAWGQTWPNLLANVLWVPVAWMYHRLVVARKFRELREHQTALHRQHEELLVQHVLGRAEGAQQYAADGRLPTKGP